MALAALADQFSEITAPARRGDRLRATAACRVPAVSLRAEFYYALFRAGLPANPDSLFRTSPGDGPGDLAAGHRPGRHPAGAGRRRPGAVRGFQALSAAHIARPPPPAAGLSTLQEMLAATLPEPAQQQRVRPALHPAPGRLGQLLAGRRAGVREPRRDGQLQLTGQLYYLTVNNAAAGLARCWPPKRTSPLTSAAGPGGPRVLRRRPSGRR